MDSLHKGIVMGFAVTMLIVHASVALTTSNPISRVAEVITVLTMVGLMNLVLARR